MFERLRGMVKGMAEGLEKKKDVFELAGVPAWREFYNNGVFVWKCIYKGFYTPWHIIGITTPNKPETKRKISKLGIGKASAQELASLIWSERCEVNVSSNGDDTRLNDFVQKVLDANNFFTKMGEHIEQTLSLGGGALKVYYEDEIKIDYVLADQFVPVKWDNKETKEALFVSRKAMNGKYYTKLEWHNWRGESYVIKNELYRSADSDILGVKCPLDEAYPMLEEETVIENIGTQLFTYYKPASANNLDDNSPLGISIYANALDTLHALDNAFDGLCEFIRLGKPKIVVPYTALRTVVDPSTGMQRKFFDPNEDVFVGLNFDANENFEIKDITINLHVDEHISAINSLLNIYCLQTGFSPSTFTFDTEDGVKTATEVVSENSKTYKTVKNHQGNVRGAIEHLVRNIIDVAVLYDAEFNGTKIASLVGSGYEVNIAFDDSVIQDTKTNLETGIMLLSNGLLSKKEFLTNPKYGICYTEEQAEEMIAQINEETRGVNMATMELFNRDTMNG